VLSLAIIMTRIPDAWRTIDFDGAQENKRVSPASSMTIRWTLLPAPKLCLP
jgi:hypothetical protein